MSVRPASEHDLSAILRLVHALAEYEREPEAVESTEADFARAMFPRDGRPSAFCHVAEAEGEVVGMAVWYVTFSTWTGGNGIWLEDLFVLPEHRGAGHGRALLGALARLCVDRGHQRLEWWVLDWNEPSIGFYRSVGAEACEEWTTFRLSGSPLVALGQG